VTTRSTPPVSTPGLQGPIPSEQEGGVAFQLITELNAQLSQGELHLPALPEVVALIRQALARDDVSTAHLADLVLSDPALSGTILKLANSVMYRRGDSETTNMTVCINRLGTRLVRSVSMHFAMQQLERAPEFRHVRALLEPEWHSSRLVSELCYSLSRHSRRAHPDDMLTLGLVHNIGRIYILSQAGQQARKLAENPAAAALLERWHPAVGSAIAAHWELPANAIEAIANQGGTRQEDSRAAGGDDSRALLVIAVDIATHRAADPSGTALPDASHLGLSAAMLETVLDESHEFGEVLMVASDPNRIW